MGEHVGAAGTSGDQPLLDTTAYGSGKDDSVTETAENAAVTHHMATIGGNTLRYTARAGHLVIADPISAQPAATIFYVSFTLDDAPSSARPVTFFYNGGPGSSSVFLLLGSFAPRRIETSMPAFTPPAPYRLIDNHESLLDQSDLVFVNPVGTGYSAAIAPNKNGDFWGVDQDARSIEQFVKRYLTVYNRWNSPKFLFGESYGTPRTCVLTWFLHEDGVDLNGIVLQSSILDYGAAGNPIGLLPTFAADAWYHGKATLAPRPADLAALAEKSEKFARTSYAAALAAFPNADAASVQELSALLGVPPVVVKYWRLDVDAGGGSVFLTSLLLDQGLACGAYDGRVTASDTGIAAAIAPDSGGNDPTMTAVGGVYTAMWNIYLNDELAYTATAPFVDLNDQAFLNWDFSHIDPTGAERGGPESLYTAGDLAAAMALNPYLKVFSANGYYDAVTPLLQTILNFEAMPLADPRARANLSIHAYPSGHMVYLDDASRAAMKSGLVPFYRSAVVGAAAAAEGIAAKESGLAVQTRYRRKLSRVRY